MGQRRGEERRGEERDVAGQVYDAGYEYEYVETAGKYQQHVGSKYPEPMTVECPKIYKDALEEDIDDMSLLVYESVA